jgi:hypothetical protein
LCVDIQSNIIIAGSISRKTITPIYNTNTYSQEGVAGLQKVPTQLVIEKPRNLDPLPGQQIQTPVSSKKKDIMLGIISKDNLHISSFPINQDQLEVLEATNFWVLKGRNIK